MSTTASTVGTSYIFIHCHIIPRNGRLRGPWLLTLLHIGCDWFHGMSQGVAELLQVAPWLDGQILCNRFLSYHWLMFWDALSS